MQGSVMTGRDQEMQNPKPEEPQAGSHGVTRVPSSSGVCEKSGQKKIHIFHQPCDFPKKIAEGSHFRVPDPLYHGKISRPP